jgi:hypothetical protein
MTLILTPAFVVTGDDRDPTAPVLGWTNYVTVQGVSATYETGENPATNLANPATNLIWRSTSSDVQYVTFLIDEEETIDYIGIARHNFGSGGTIVEVEIRLFADDEWSTLVEGFVVATDAPILVRFLNTSVNALRLKLTPLAVVPEMAVVHVGRMLVMPIGIPVGHTPLIDGVTTRTASGNSEAGDYLGSIMLSQKLSTSVAFQYIEDSWYRLNLRPLVKAGRGTPFFYSGLPNSHPEEAGYAWLISDPRPSFIEAGWVNITLDIGGIVE